MAEVLHNPVIASRWRLHALLLGVAYLALGVGFAGTFANLVGIWTNSSTFNHCFLIPFIAVYLGYTRRDELERHAPSVSMWGLAFVAANGVLWMLGEVMSLAVFMHAAVVGMIIGCAWALLGQSIFKQLLFPFFYLYFAVPEGEFLVPYLQDWTALVLVSLLKLIGMPVFVEGRYVSIPSGSFTVAEACSGINYLIATLSVATMFAYLQFHSYWRRAIFMVAAVVVPLVANGMRAFGIVMISHLSDYTLAKGVDHFIYGWVFFGFVITILFWVGRSFSDIDDPRYRAVDTGSIPPRHEAGGRPLVVLALALLLAFGPRAGLLAMDSARPLADAIALPSIAGWRGPEQEASTLGTRFPGADQQPVGRYVSADGAVVIVELAYFREQGEKGELVNQNNRVFDAEQWRQISHAVRDLPADAPLENVNELHLRSGAQKEFLLWYWYDAQGERSRGGFPIKLAEGRARLRGSNAGSAMISIRAEVAHGGPDAAASLHALLASDALFLENLHVRP